MTCTGNSFQLSGMLDEYSLRTYVLTVLRKSASSSECPGDTAVVLVSFLVQLSVAELILRWGLSGN